VIATTKDRLKVVRVYIGQNPSPQRRPFQMSLRSCVADDTINRVRWTGCTIGGRSAA